MTDFTTSPTDDGGAITPPRALDADGDGVGDVTPAAAPSLPEVAARRGWQALWQGLGVDVLVAVALVLLASLSNVERWEDFLAPALTLAVGKSIVQAAAAWVVRRYVDRSGYNADGTPKSLG